MEDRTDILLRQIANNYAETYGRSLISEVHVMEQQNVRYMLPRADARIKKLTGGGNGFKRAIRIASTIAACFILVLTVTLVVNRVGDETPGSDAPTSESIGLPDWTQVQPLSFVLPTEFDVDDRDIDNGMTIYRLESSDYSDYDNVVLTMQDPAEQSGTYNHMEALIVNGVSVPAKVDDNYKLITFENEGIRYTLTCEDDLGTLAYLYRSITASPVET